ncbi:MAG: MFS transporter [Miltoncostaeaceae bacterium]
MSRLAYALILLGAFLVYTSANAPVPIAGELRASLSLTGDEAALFMVPFAVGFGIGCVMWFLVARQAGPRVLPPLALSLIGVANLIVVVADTTATAGTARFAVGLASAAFPAAAQSLISQAAAPGVRGRMTGGFGAAVVSGGVLGQTAVGALADLRDAPTALTILCGIAPLVCAVALRAALPATIGAGGGPPPARIPRLLRQQWPPIALAALLYGSYWLMLSELSEAVRADRFELTAAQTGLLPILGLAGVLTTLGGGWLTDRLGFRVPILATIALGVVALAVTIPAGGPLWLFAVGYGVFIAAYWGFLAPGAGEVAHRSHEGDRQPAMMVFYAAAWAGASIFGALGPLLPSWEAAAWVTLGAWVLAGAIAAWRFAGRAGVVMPASAGPIR